MPKVAILVGDGYEDSEFEVPYERLRNAGMETTIVGIKRGATAHGKRGESSIEIQHTADELSEEDYDAVVIPGGHGPDKLRTDEAMVDFTQRFCASGKPVAAICHGPQLLIEAEAVKDRTVTSWPSVRKDLINAGAHWVNKEVVEDRNLITSRKPADLDAFCEALLGKLADAG